MHHELAPVALFAYKRLDHLKVTLEHLSRNPEASRTRLYVFSDGPKTAADQAAVAEVRRHIAGITGFAAVEVIEQAQNRGLASSIINGVTRVLADHDRVIVVEDDLLVSPYFLDYMNRGLAMYDGDETVASIHGYWYPRTPPMPETFFLRGADCWGWATWRRAWRHFNPDGQTLLKALADRGLSRQFDMEGHSGFLDMLRGQIEGRNDSWAIRWHAATFLDGMYTLYPGRSLVRNIGHDGTGTHCTVPEQEKFDVTLSPSPVTVARIPVMECDAARDAFIRFLRRCQPGLLRRIPGRVKKLLRSAGSATHP
jgi:hypothetical protein